LLLLPKPKDIPDGFLTASTAARLLGCSVQNIRTNYLPKLTGDSIIQGRPVRIRFSALIDLIVERRVEERTRAPVQASDDPLLAEGDSPALERYRLAKAKHAELDLEQRRAELIDLAKCRDLFGRWGSVIRKMGDRVSKRFGSEANQMVAEAIDECDSIVRGLGNADG
jgi:phage terminase Nu1 subunit (DNA packaging protein)